MHVPQAPQFVKPGPADPFAGEPLHWTVARFRRRAFASAFDGAVVIGLAFVAMMPVWQLSDRAGPFSETAGWTASTGPSSTTGDLLITSLEFAIVAAVWVLYLAILPLRSGPEHGQTLGMRALGLRLVMVGGTALTKRASWQRTLTYVGLSALGIVGPLADALFGTAPKLSDAVDVLSLLAYGAIFVLALSSDARRLIFDRFAGTIVVLAEPGGVRPETEADLHTAPASGLVGFVHGAHPAPIPVRETARTASTWILLALLLLGLVGMIAGTVLSPEVYLNVQED